MTALESGGCDDENVKITVAVHHSYESIKTL